MKVWVGKTHPYPSQGLSCGHIYFRAFIQANSQHTKNIPRPPRARAAHWPPPSLAHKATRQGGLCGLQCVRGMCPHDRIAIGTNEPATRRSFFFPILSFCSLVVASIWRRYARSTSRLRNSIGPSMLVITDRIMLFKQLSCVHAIGLLV